LDKLRGADTFPPPVTTTVVFFYINFYLTYVFDSAIIFVDLYCIPLHTPRTAMLDDERLHAGTQNIMIPLLLGILWGGLSFVTWKDPIMFVYLVPLIMLTIIVIKELTVNLALVLFYLMLAVGTILGWILGVTLKATSVG
jgi:hypothetical protein